MLKSSVLYPALENVCRLISHSRSLGAQILCSLSRPVKRLSACFTLAFAWCSNPLYSIPPCKTPVSLLHTRVHLVLKSSTLPRLGKRQSAYFELAFAWCSNPLYPTPPWKTPVSLLRTRVRLVLKSLLHPAFENACHRPNEKRWRQMKANGPGLPESRHTLIKLH